MLCAAARTPRLEDSSMVRNAFPWLLASIVAVAIAMPAHAAEDDLSVNARLLLAARNADAGGVDRALKSGAAANSRNRLGETALLIALKKNDLGLAKTMLDAGTDINLAAINGVTPL